MNPFNMNPMSGMGQDEGTNLFTIILHIVFGFVVGLMLFVGPKEVIAYGSKLAGQLIKMSGYGSQMTAFGFAQTAAPYVVLAPLGGLVVKQLSAVKTLKGFAYFAVAVLAGCAAAYFAVPHVVPLMK